VIDIDIHQNTEDDTEWVVSDNGGDFDDCYFSSYQDAIDDAESRAVHYGSERCVIARDGINI
jgi:hypothetical protein